MCMLCNAGRPQNHFSRRNFLKSAAATGFAATGINLFAPRPAAATDDDDPPRDSGRPGRRYLIRGGSVMSMDPRSATSCAATCWSKASGFSRSGRNLFSGNVDVIDARGRIVMPGFIDTHHHQAGTAIRSSIPDSILIDDGTGTPSAQHNYFEYILFEVRAQSTGRRTSTSASCSADWRNSTTASRRCTTSRRSITRPQHSDAAIKALFDTGRRAAFGYFESAGASVIGTNPGNQYPPTRRASNSSGSRRAISSST